MALVVWPRILLNLSEHLAYNGVAVLTFQSTMLTTCTNLLVLRAQCFYVCL